MTKKNNNEKYISWFEYNNIAAIVATAILIASSLWGLKIQLAVFSQRLEDHFTQSEEQIRQVNKLIDNLQDHEKRLTVLEVKDGITKVNLK